MVSKSGIKQSVIGLREQILARAKQHGGVRVRLFGSAVRDQTDCVRDIDLLVTYEPGRSLVDHIKLIESLASLFDLPVDVVPEDALPAAFRNQVLKEAIDI